MNAPWATPRAMANLELLSGFCPQPARIQGIPHLSTSASPCLHSDIATWFRYDQDSFDLVRNYLTAVLLEAPTFPSAAIASSTAHFSYNRPFPVEGEAGIVTDIIRRLIDPLIPSDVVRQWQQRAGSFHLGLQGDLGAWLAHCELKSGFNDIRGLDRIVLGPTFFDSLILYLESTGGVAYSETTQDLVDYPMRGEQGLAVFQGRDPSDKENIRRVLCQIRHEMCRTQLTQPDKGNRYYVLCTFRHAVLLTLHVDEITVSPVVSIDGDCTQDRPLGNVAALFYAMSNLPDDMYDIPIPQRHRYGLRERRSAGHGGPGPGPGTGAGAGQGAGVGPGAERAGPRPPPPSGARGREGGGGSQRPGQRTRGPVDGLLLHSLTHRVVSDTSDSSASTSTDSYCQTLSTPTSSPLSATFSAKIDPVSYADAARQCRRLLKVDFDLAYNIGGQTLASDPSGPKIVNRGVYLCHPILAGIPGLRGPLLSPPLWTESEPWPRPQCDDETTETDTDLPNTDTIVVGGYLGIGATSTVFSGSTDTGLAVAVKYSCPDLYPTVGRAGSWDCYQVREAIRREMAVYARLERLDVSDAEPTSTVTLPCAPRWFGSWYSKHRVLGHVWCSVMEAGEPVGIDTMTTEERVQIVETYRRLHSLGIIHGDVSPKNLCRIVARDSADGAFVDGTTGSETLQTSPTPMAMAMAKKTRVAIIDFGLAFITKEPPPRYDSTAPTAPVHDEAGGDKFSRLAADEMARVMDMVGTRLGI